MTLKLRKTDGKLGNSDVGYIIIPEGVDRNEYVASCYRTNMVSINGGFGYGIFNNVLCPTNVLMDINFPQDSKTRGTPVIWVKNDHTGLPIIVNSLNEEGEIVQIEENQYRIKRKIGTSFIDFFINPKNNEMRMNLYSDEKNPSNLIIKTCSKNKNSMINLFSDCDVSINSEKNITINSENNVEINIKEKNEIKTKIKYVLKEGLSYLDEFENEINIDKNKVEIIPKEKFILNDGKEKMVLGDTLKDILSEFIDKVAGLSTINCIQGSPVTLSPSTIAELQLLKSKLINFLSNKNKLS